MKIGSLAVSLLTVSLIGVTACTRSNSLHKPASQTSPSAPEAIEPSPVAPPTGATPGPAGTAAADQTIIPGERVGPVTATTSRKDLAALYGEAVLNDAPVAMGEGTTEPGTRVELGTDRRFTIVWLDAERTQPLLAKDFGPAWKIPEGLGVGVPYARIKAVLGDFQLYGFGWDYQGTLSLEGSRLDQYHGDLLLRVAPADTAAAKYPEAYGAVVGDTLFPGNDPNLQPLDISVYEMVVYLNSLEELK
ncbi:MAG: hypothetical protein ACFCVD_09590 [Nodosilinea sp.]